MKKGDIFTNAGRRFVARKVDEKGNVIEAQPAEQAAAADEAERKSLVEKIKDDPNLRAELKNELREELLRELEEQGLTLPEKGDKSPQEDERTTCKYCGRKCKTGLEAHENACKEEPERKAELIKQAKDLGIETDGKSGEELSKDIKAKK